ncbi:hypothetical protein [Xenorhabdus beddingii]|uniref:hypothetical protein n=1 Tax=Xenorhabdus beddingii TaxID=40578 RepID=UPI00111C68EA|nr:hypothetical protein [Xenorhabdus beddingii]
MTERKAVRLTACLITSIVKAQRYKADVMKEPKPLACVFENPPMSVALDILNATDPPFKIEPRHITGWFKEGRIGMYHLIDDIRELWFKEKLGYLFGVLLGEAENYKYLATRFCHSDWVTTIQSGINLTTGEINEQKIGEESKCRSYEQYAINNAEELYTDDKQKNTNKKTGTASHKTPAEEYTAYEDFPMPEPVIPRFELEKIYSLIHNTPISKNSTKPTGETVSIKTFNTLARFTKAVLHASYDSDTAEYPRRAMDNPNSAICQAFKNAGVAHLDGRKIQDYFNEVACEITPHLENVDIKMVRNK